MTNQGQDLAQWFHRSLLPPVLEAGEVIGLIGKATCDGPVTRDASGRIVGLFSGMKWAGQTSDANADAFIVFTSTRVLLMPGFVFMSEHGQQNIVYGLSSIRWSAVTRINVPSEAISGQKRYLNLHLYDPSNPNGFTVVKLAIWFKDDGIATQRDFFDRAAAVAQERVQSAQAARVPAPPRAWDVLFCNEINDRPDMDALAAVKRAERAAAHAKRYSPKNVLRAGSVLALLAALGAAGAAANQWSEHIDSIDDTRRVQDSLRREEGRSSALSRAETEFYRLRDENRLSYLRRKTDKTMAQGVALSVAVVSLAALSAWLFVRAKKLPSTEAGAALAPA